MEGSSEKGQKKIQGTQLGQKQMDLAQGKNKKRKKKGGCGCGKKNK
jgi:hypothetical protein